MEINKFYWRIDDDGSGVFNGFRIPEVRHFRIHWVVVMLLIPVQKGRWFGRPPTQTPVMVLEVLLIGDDCKSRHQENESKFHLQNVIIVKIFTLL